RGALRLARPRLLRAAELAWRPGQRRARGSGRGPLERAAHTGARVERGSAPARSPDLGDRLVRLLGLLRDPAVGELHLQLQPDRHQLQPLLGGRDLCGGRASAALGLRAMVARVAVTTGVTVFALSGLVSLLENEELATGSASYSLIHQVERYLDSQGLDMGYSNYWDGAPIMWSSHFHIKAYPVQDCAPNLCWSYLHMITSWYTTLRPHQRSFLISDAAQAVSSAPTPNLGKPTSVQKIGALTVYVYPYDIASRMTP